MFKYAVTFTFLLSISTLSFLTSFNLSIKKPPAVTIGLEKFPTVIFFHGGGLRAGNKNIPQLGGFGGGSINGARILSYLIEFLTFRLQNLVMHY